MHTLCKGGVTSVSVCRVATAEDRKLLGRVRDHIPALHCQPSIGLLYLLLDDEGQLSDPSQL